MKQQIFDESNILKVLTSEGKLVRRGVYGSTYSIHKDPSKENSIECIHNFKGLKSNITLRFGHFTDYEGNISLRTKEHAKDFEEFLNESIIEYELVEKKRMTMRQYLEETGKLTRVGDE
jgi:hypothetical protein